MRRSHLHTRFHPQSSSQCGTAVAVLLPLHFVWYLAFAGQQPPGTRLPRRFLSPVMAVSSASLFIPFYSSSFLSAKDSKVCFASRGVSLFSIPFIPSLACQRSTLIVYSKLFYLPPAGPYLLCRISNSKSRVNTPLRRLTFDQSINQQLTTIKVTTRDK